MSTVLSSLVPRYVPYAFGGVVGAEVRAVRVRRHRELVDLFAQRRDVLTRLTESRGEPFVLGHRLGELALGLEEPLLEGAHALGCVLQPPAQDDHLFLQ
jgi:hypothetical protein